MQMEMRLGQKQTQVQILAPRMIQSMEILQMPVMALMERLQAEMEKNPVLELRETSDDPSASEDFKGTESLPPEKPKDHDAEELVLDPKSGENEFDRLEAMTRDYGDYINEEHRPSRGGMDEEGDKKHDAMQNMASPPESLRDHLEEQIVYLGLEPEQENLVRFIINSFIDRTGYVGARVSKEKIKKPEDESKRTRKKKKKDRESIEDILRDLEEVFTPITLEDIARIYNEELVRNNDATTKPVTVEQVEEALFAIQKMDPAGIGARDLKECLLLQVSDEMPHADAVRALIEHHLEDIQHNRLMVIQRRTGFELELIKEAIELLRHLNPKPGLVFTSDTNRYIVPDIAIEQKEDGTYDIRLLDDWVPDVYVSRRYFEMSRDRQADPSTREWLKRKIQDALWLKEAIQQRRNTLEKVTRAIIDHQKAFLDRKQDFIQPLKMQQIADQVKVHVTTVSRAVDDKYVQTPRGVYPLKRFFGGASHNDQTGQDIAWEQIKQKLEELIAGENKANPLSDEELVESLKKQGFPIKRRTVTKYRKMLNIPSSRQRKDWALIEDSKAEPVMPSDEMNAPHDSESSSEMLLHEESPEPVLMSEQREDGM